MPQGLGVMSLTHLWKDKVCGKYCTFCRFFLGTKLKKYMTEKLSQISKFRNKVFLILEWGHRKNQCQLLPPYLSLWTTLEAVWAPAGNWGDCTCQHWSTRMATCHIFWTPNTQLKYVCWRQVVWWGENWVTRWRRILLTTACVLFYYKLIYIILGPSRKTAVTERSGLKS